MYPVNVFEVSLIYYIYILYRDKSLQLKKKRIVNDGLIRFFTEIRSILDSTSDAGRSFTFAYKAVKLHDS